MMTCRHEYLGRPDAGGADLNDVVAVGEGEADVRHELVRRVPGGNCIKIGLHGKLILGDYYQENGTSRRPFL